MIPQEVAAQQNKSRVGTSVTVCFSGLDPGYGDSRRLAQGRVAPAQRRPQLANYGVAHDGFDLFARLRRQALERHAHQDAALFGQVLHHLTAPDDHSPPSDLEPHPQHRSIGCASATKADSPLVLMSLVMAVTAPDGNPNSIW